MLQIVGRCAQVYLSQDRCELQFAVKELCETNAAAKHQEHAGTQTSGAILEGKSEMPGRLQQTNLKQPFVDVFSDSDWAGCTKTRRSTSSSYVMLGGHLLVSSATTQKRGGNKFQVKLSFTALAKSASKSSGSGGYGRW